MHDDAAAESESMCAFALRSIVDQFRFDPDTHELELELAFFFSSLV